MRIYEQITEYKLSKRLTNAEMGELIGKSGEAFRMALKRKSLSQLELEKIKSLFDESNNISNQMVSEPMAVFATKSGNRFEELKNGKFILYTKVVPVKAQASYISSYQDADFIDDLTEVSWIVDRVVKGAYRAFEIMNDSMNDGSINSVPDGCFVLGRELGKHLWKDGIRFNQYDKWIIVHQDTVMCKQIIDHDIEKGTITLHSFNPSPEYQEYTIIIKKGSLNTEVKKVILKESMNLWMELMAEAGPDDFIFSDQLAPGPKHKKRAYITQKWKRQVKDALNLEPDLYSLKHSLLDSLPLDLASKMASHTSSNTTAIYRVNQEKRDREVLKNLQIKFN